MAIAVMKDICGKLDSRIRLFIIFFDIDLKICVFTVIETLNTFVIDRLFKILTLFYTRCNQIETNFMWLQQIVFK